MNCTGTEAHISSCNLGPQVSQDPVKNVTCENGLPVVVSCVPGQVFSSDGPSRFRKAYKPEVRVGYEVWLLAPGWGEGWQVQEGPKERGHQSPSRRTNPWAKGLFVVGHHWLPVHEQMAQGG